MILEEVVVEEADVELYLPTSDCNLVVRANVVVTNVIVIVSISNSEMDNNLVMF